MWEPPGAAPIYERSAWTLAHTKSMGPSARTQSQRRNGRSHTHNEKYSHRMPRLRQHRRQHRALAIAPLSANSPNEWEFERHLDPPYPHRSAGQFSHLSARRPLALSAPSAFPACHVIPHSVSQCATQCVPLKMPPKKAAQLVYWPLESLV